MRKLQYILFVIPLLLFVDLAHAGDKEDVLATMDAIKIAWIAGDVDGARKHMLPELKTLAWKKSFGGSLDTSCMIPWLREHYGAEIITYTGDLGQGMDLEGVREKALDLEKWPGDRNPADLGTKVLQGERVRELSSSCSLGPAFQVKPIVSCFASARVAAVALLAQLLLLVVRHG